MPTRKIVMGQVAAQVGDRAPKIEEMYVKSKWTHDQIAGFLTYTGWDNATYAWDVAPGDSISFDVRGLTDAGRSLARTALAAWESVTGIGFTEVSSGAKILFDDNQPGAMAQFIVMGDHIVEASVNVGSSWLSDHGTALNSYSFQTYLHEIGHVLGLAHPGHYNGRERYGVDNHFQYDSWQQTVMSYFDQDDNTAVKASFAYVITPQIVDIIALQNLYGVAGNIRTGNTVYGNNSNAGGIYDQIASLRNVTFTILDDGGIDTLDTSSYSGWQQVNLNPETHSSVFGETGNLGIARGTVLENYIGGSGTDFVLGNDAANRIELNDGDDTAYGGGGDDYIDGGAGQDRLVGNEGDDTLIGGPGNDILKGKFGNNTLNGGSGDDKLIGSDDGNDVLHGGSGRDILSGLGGEDELHGEDDGDWLYGGLGNDALYGGAGDDLLRGNRGDDYLDGGTGSDRLFGGGGNDVLYGGPGRDFLLGEGGDDILDGGAGDDNLTGGPGADIFVYRTLGHGNDRILDFEAGIDRIDLTGLGFTGVADIRPIATDLAEGARIDFGAGDSLRIDGIFASDLDASDFIF